MPSSFKGGGEGAAVLLAARGEARRRFGLLGVPHDAATTIGNPGARYGPGALREMLVDWFGRRVRDGKIADLERGILDLSEVEVLDFGDVEISYADPAAAVEETAAAVAQIIAAGALPISIGGDHGVTFPAFRALHDATPGPVGLVQLDAHADLDPGNPRQGRYSGSSGMRRALELERLQGDHLVQIGLRGYTSVEQYEIGERLGVPRITCAEVEAVGAAAVAARTLDLLKGVDAVHLTVDLDVLDPGSAPGSGWAEPAGMRTADLFAIVRALAPRLAGFDVAELNPLFDARSGATAILAARLVLDLITADLSDGGRGGAARLPQGA